MTDATPDDSRLPSDVESSLRAIRRFEAERRQTANFYQRAVNACAFAIAKPAALAVYIGAIAAWAGGNYLVSALGRAPIDPPPFQALALVTSVSSLLVAILILAAQRHDDEGSRQREWLALELALLNERKAAKIIELLEESRRDSSVIPDRADVEADTLSAPVDPAVMLQAAKDRQT